MTSVFQDTMVRDGEEIGFNVYGVRREDIWVMYKKQHDFALRSSDVLAVCRRTGKVLYEGSAFDEG